MSFAQTPVITPLSPPTGSLFPTKPLLVPVFPF